jgi:hypothetical protein
LIKSLNINKPLSKMYDSNSIINRMMTKNKGCLKIDPSNLCAIHSGFTYFQQRLF